MAEVNGVGLTPKAMIEIKTKNGQFNVSESLYESFSPSNGELGSKVSLKNGLSVFMPVSSEGSVTIKDSGNIQIFAEGTQAIIDAKNNENDNLYVSANNSTVYISNDEDDDITTRTLDGYSSSIRNGGAKKYLQDAAVKTEKKDIAKEKADAEAQAKAAQPKEKNHENDKTKLLHLLQQESNPALKEELAAIMDDGELNETKLEAIRRNIALVWHPDRPGGNSDRMTEYNALIDNLKKQ